MNTSSIITYIIHVTKKLGTIRMSKNILQNGYFVVQCDTTVDIFILLLKCIKFGMTVGFYWSTGTPEVSFPGVFHDQ
jgi:hypothetical protein